MIKTIIVEDQVKKSNDLNELLEQYFPEIEVLKICSTLKDAVKQVIALQPQLIFLDVELDDGYTGFDLLEQTRSVNYKVIFTTSYSKYAARAFRFSTIDYIEGLYGFKELNEAITRYKSLPAFTPEVNTASSETEIDVLLHNAKYFDNIRLQKIGIPVLKGIDFISLSDIIYCKAVDNCTDFYLTGKRKIRATKTLKWVNEMLFEYRFFRSHASYFVNLDHIVSYRKEGFKGRKDGEDGEGGIIELSEQMEAPVSRRKREELLRILSNKK